MMDVMHTGPLQVNTLVVHLNDRFVFVVDPAGCDFCGDRNCVSDFLEENGLVPVAFVLTHGHFDHVANVGHLKALYPEVPLLIHAGDASCIGPDGSVMQKRGLYLMNFEEFTESVSGLPAADGFLEDSKTLCDVSGVNFAAGVEEMLGQWKVIGTPGHTPGSVCLYNEREKVLISGDTVFYRSFGRTDLPLGSESDMEKSLDRIYSSIPGDVKVFPGHGLCGFMLCENAVCGGF